MTDSLIRKRQAIQALLDPHKPADGLASYYALHHSDRRTTLLVHRDQNGQADGFLALSRTGMDLFRPLLSLRAENENVAAELLESALPPEAAVIIAVPLALRPLVEAFFVVSSETVASIYQLRPGTFRPIINVLVTRAPTPGGDPRFVVRGQSFDRGAQALGPALATAGVNWRSPDFADIYVKVEPQARGRDLGKSVVSALCTWLLEKGAVPLYTVAADNQASARLAASLGFTNTGSQAFLCDGLRRGTAFPFHKSVVE